MSVKVTVHSTGLGPCSLTGKECEGLSVSFENGRQRFLSWKAFRQLLCMETAEQNGKPTGAMPAAPAIGNAAGVK